MTRSRFSFQSHRARSSTREPEREDHRCMRQSRPAGRIGCVRCWTGARMSNCRVPNSRRPFTVRVSLFVKARNMERHLLESETIERRYRTVSRYRASLEFAVSRRSGAWTVAAAIRHRQLIPGFIEAFEKSHPTGDSREAREIISILLDAGADVNAILDAQMWTPFLYSAEIGNRWLLWTLLDHGADPRSRLPHGETALVLLNSYDHTALATEFMSWLEPDDRLWLRENGRSSHRC